MNPWIRVAALTAAATITGAGCSSALTSSGSPSGFGDSSAPPTEGSPGGGNGGVLAGSDGGPSTLPPETKAEGNYQSPVATGQIVWIANPTSGRVAYVDASTLEVRTVEAGDGPTYLAAVPDPIDDVAIALNVRSHDATLLRDHQQTLTTKTFPVTADANTWAVAGGGRWAVAWTDASRVKNADPTQGFQDVAVLDLSGARPPTILAVGYRPVKLAFSGDGTRAFAVTQDGISVVDLVGGSQPKVTQNFSLADTAPDASASAAATSDVSFTPDGAFALVRRDGEAAITIVSLKDGTPTTVSFPSPPTDLTLSPAGDFAIAVLRDTSTVAVLPLPAIVASPGSYATIAITGETVGRAIVTKGGKSAILFTTAASIGRITVLSLDATPSFRVINLHSPVLAVFPSDDAQSAIVLHNMTPAPGSTVKGAFSVVPIGSSLPAKIVGTPAPPTAVAVAPSSDRALIAMRDDAAGVYGVYLAKMPSLEVVRYTLASPPIAVGIAAAAGHGYIAQDHPEGRITLLDLAKGQARTITGFELGSRVVDGSNP